MKTIIYRCDECHQAEIIDIPARFHEPISPLTTIQNKDWCQKCIDHMLHCKQKQEQ